MDVELINRLVISFKKLLCHIGIHCFYVEQKEVLQRGNVVKHHATQKIVWSYFYVRDYVCENCGITKSKIIKRSETR